MNNFNEIRGKEITAILFIGNGLFINFAVFIYQKKMIFIVKYIPDYLKLMFNFIMNIFKILFYKTFLIRKIHKV